MPTIKGGITFKKGETIKNIEKVVGKLRLPFTATNFKCKNKELEKLVKNA